jgi:ubiquitin-protein ligase
MASTGGTTVKTTPPCPARLAQVLLSQYRAYVAAPYPNLLARPDDQDLRVWHFLVAGLEEPYTGGEYLFRLTAPDEFPARPPRFEFLTHNGVYALGGPICISIGEFHADNRPGRDGAHGWRPSLGMHGFATQVVNGMIVPDTLGSGIRIDIQPRAIRAILAKNSRKTNACYYPSLVAAFEALAVEMAGSEPARCLLRGRGCPVPAPPAPALAPTPTPTPFAAFPTPPAHRRSPARPDNVKAAPEASMETAAQVAAGDQAASTSNTEKAGCADHARATGSSQEAIIPGAADEAAASATTADAAAEATASEAAEDAADEATASEAAEDAADEDASDSTSAAAEDAADEDADSMDQYLDILLS